MNPIIIIILFSSLSLFSLIGITFAYNEPESFADLKFGEDLTRQIKACPNNKDKFPDWDVWDRAGDRCYQKLGSSFRLWNLGMPDGVYRITAQQLNGKLAMVELLFTNSNTAIILATFKQRYGAPTGESVKSWLSRGGAKATNRTASWMGKSVSIFFEERGAKIDEGRIVYQTKAWSDEQDRLNAEAVKKGASGL